MQKTVQYQIVEHEIVQYQIVPHENSGTSNSTILR